MDSVVLFVAVPCRLRGFLHRRPARTGADRPGSVTVTLSESDARTATLGHVVQSLGLPLTEVGELRLDGVPVDPGRRVLRGGDLETVERRRPQAAPSDPVRFVLDVHLGTLARRLRLLGLDTAYSNGASDDALVARSAAERRVLLTRDLGLLRRKDARWGAFVRGQQPDDQLVDVLDRFRPELRPWSRCPACNGAVEPADVAEVADQLRPGTLRTYTVFSRCRCCGRAYWRGAHARRLEQLIARLT
jgi:uncharacterized protein with PIN domain